MRGFGARIRFAAASWAWTATYLLFGCGRDPDQEARAQISPPSTHSASTPQVEFAACDGRNADRTTCTLPEDDSEVLLWIAAPVVPSIEVDHQLAQARIEPARGETGWTAAVRVPAHARELTVRDALALDSPPWRLGFARHAPTPTLAAIQRLLPDHNAPGRTAKLLDVMRQLEQALPTLTGHERHKALRLATVVSLDAGDVEAANGHGKRALDEALAGGQLHDVIEIGLILGRTLANRAERAWVLHLVELCIPLAGDAREYSDWLYARGSFARESGDIGTALADLAEAEAIARRLGMRDFEIQALSGRGHELALIGDTAAIQALTRRAVELVATPGGDPCADATLLIGMSWTLWLSRSLGGDAGDPEPLLHRAERYYQDLACVPGDNRIQRDVARELQLNAALAATEGSDREKLRKRVAAVERHEPTPTQREWLTYVDAELQAAEGDFGRALTSARSLTASHDPLLAWKAHLLIARTQASRGRRDRALTEYLAAEDLLERAAARLAPDQGRAGLAATFQASASHAIALALDSGDIAGAAATARRARARRMRPTGSAAAIAQLPPAMKARHADAMARYRRNSAALERELSEAWLRPADERARSERERAAFQAELREAIQERDAILRGVEETLELSGTRNDTGLSLLYHPLPQGWVGFAITDGAVTSHQFELPPLDDPQATSTALLTPFEAEIASADSIRILASNELLSLPFHMLPWKGHPLVHTSPVAYGLDIGRVSRNTKAARTAVVVADPETRVAGLGQLPNALAEGDIVGERLTTDGWVVRRLAGRDATASAVTDAMRGAGWLHYAGHGIQAGTGGWHSALLLAGESTLDVSDILALEEAPRAVVLSACDAGGSQTARRGDAQMAIAFLLAGSDFVVAAAGNLEDAGARQFSAALYRAPISTPIDGPAIVRRAMIGMQQGESATAGFFVWVP